MTVVVDLVKESRTYSILLLTVNPGGCRGKLFEVKGSGFLHSPLSGPFDLKNKSVMTG